MVHTLCLLTFLKIRDSFNILKIKETDLKFQHGDTCFNTILELYLLFVTNENYICYFQEFERRKQEREEAQRLYKKKKMEMFKILSKKTKKGQPNLNLQMEYLLKKIQENN